MRNHWLVKRLARGALGCCVVAVLALSVADGAARGAGKSQAGPGSEPVKAVSPPAAPKMTRADMTAFIDGIVPLQLARDDIAGAVVVVVKDGQIVFEKGYGYADVKAKRTVSPSGTLFRVGSISKLFTWTAVMQLVEQGKLNLDRNVNDYLDFQIPATYPQPITLRDLMTHTPGFEEAVKDLFVPSAGDMVPLGTYVKLHLPARIYPPGTVPAYSNYGAALSGYIVQRISGMPFDEYAEKNILQPLGMTHSTFRQPLPQALLPLASRGHFVGSGPPGKYEIVQAFPAGSLATTGEDIARFMIAQLDGGRYDDHRILRAETVQEMLSRQFGLVPSMNGMALGFYEESRNGYRIFGHSGDTVFFHSALHLIPYANLGFFVSYNSVGRDNSAVRARSYLWKQFLDRYFPYTPATVVPPVDAAADAASVAGDYISSRRWETSFMKLVSVLSEVKVKTGAGGTLRIGAFKQLDGQPIVWQEIAPMIWRNARGQSRLTFRRDQAGRREMVVDFPAVVFTRVSRWEASGLVQDLIAGIVVVMLLELALWPVAVLVRRHYGILLERPAGERRLRLLVKMSCAIVLAVLLGWGILFTAASVQPGAASERIQPFLILLLVLEIFGVIAALLMIYNGLQAWAQRGRWWWERTTRSVVALAGLGYLWVVFSMNLLKIWRF